MRADRLPPRRQSHDESGAPSVERRLERHMPVMALGHGTYDRQAEAAPTGAVALPAEEALEDLGVQLGRDPWAVVLDRQHHLAVAPLDARLDRRSRVCVAQRV